MKEPLTSKTMVCDSCHTGLLVFVQTGLVRRPHARVYKCSHYGQLVEREPKRKSA